MKLEVAHPAQVQEVDAVAVCRALPRRTLAAHVLGLQGGLAERFNFDTLGAILERATDEELVALHRPARARR